MKTIIILAMLAFVSVPISFADQKTYQIKADDQVFDLNYDIDGKIIAMEIDKESTSLLIGTTNVQESTFSISFSPELLAATDSQFVVIVDGFETDYSVESNEATTITLQIPDDTEEIEIIGTTVVPEFPLGVLAILGVVSAAVLIFSKTRLAIFK